MFNILRIAHPITAITNYKKKNKREKERERKTDFKAHSEISRPRARLLPLEFQRSGPPLQFPWSLRPTLKRAVWAGRAEH